MPAIGLIRFRFDTMVPAMPSRIGIIGDIHAEHEHLERALAFLASHGVDTVIATGDVADGRGCLETCIELLETHSVLTVRGNHDRWVLEHKARHVPNAHLKDELSEASIRFLENLPQERRLATPRGTLMLCHGVGTNDLRKVWPGTERMAPQRSHELDTLLADGTVTMMVNGHVHYRTLIHFEALTLLNAGTLKGDHRPGFSVLDLEADYVESFEFQTQGLSCVKRQAFFAKPHHRVFASTQHFDGAWDPVTLYA